MSQESVNQGSVSAPESNGTLVRKVFLLNWIVLVALALSGWLAFSPLFAQAVVLGGLIATVSFILLKRDLHAVLSGPPKAAKIAFFVRYYARLGVLAAVLFVLIKGRMVHVVGLLIGLSTVVLSIAATMLQEAKKLYFTTREAS